MSMYNQLADRYPELVTNPGVFSVGDGWFDIIDLLCAMIYDEVATHNKNVEIRLAKMQGEDTHSYSQDLITPMTMPVIVQVKEKFGGMRFYINGSTPRMRHYIAYAEALSYRVCEECGAPGTLRTSTGWHHVMCDKHEEEYQKQRANSHLG